MSSSKPHETSMEEQRGHMAKIICMGDGVAVEPASVQGFTDLLSDAFHSDSSQLKIVSNSFPGETIQSINERLPWVMQQRFDFFLLMIGLENNTRNQFDPQFQPDWDHALRQIREAHPDVVLGIILTAEADSAHAGWLQSTAQQWQAQLLPIELPTMQEAPALWLNPAQLSAKGHQWLAGQLKEPLQQLLHHD